MYVIVDLEPGHDPCNFEIITKSQTNTDYCSVKLQVFFFLWGRGALSNPVPYDATMHKLFEQLLF